NPLLRLLLAAKRLESFALEIKNVLLTDRSARSDVPATEDFRDFSAQLHFVVSDVLPLAHEMNTHLQRREEVFTWSRNIRSRHRRFISGAHQFERPTLRVGKHALAVHGDAVGVVQESQAARLVGRG